MRILIGFMLIALSKKYNLDMPFIVGFIGITCCIIMDLKETLIGSHKHGNVTNVYMSDKYEKTSLSEAQAEDVQKTMGR